MINLPALAPPMFIDYLLDVQYFQTREHTFWGHFEPSRLSAPRYVWFSEDTIAILKHTQVSEYFPYYCLAFLPCGLFAGWLASVLHPYISFQASNLLIVREPIERLDDAHKGLDVWELILYVLSLSFMVEGMCKRTSVFD